MTAILVLVTLGLAVAQSMPAPSNLRINVPPAPDGATRLELRWDPVPGAMGYEILQWKNGDWWLNEDDPNRTPFTSSTTITGLSPDTPYEFAVRAVGERGMVSSNSQPVGGRTLGRVASAPVASPSPGLTGSKRPPVDPRAPAPEEPTGLIGVFPEQDRVQLSWRKVPGAATYQIEEEIEGQWRPCENVMGEPEANKVIILYHPRPGPFRFRVYAVGSNGKRSEPSWPVTVTRDY
ncbi:MAG: fibronectin type III domain-containing protein [Candidatus Eremiobacterota bacterium]